MSLLLSAIISLSIVVPGAIGLFRFKKMERSFFPFILLIWISFLNEMVSLASAKLFHTNTVNYDLYILLESLLITWQFKKWNFFERLHLLYTWLLAGLLITWLTEILFISSLRFFVSYFIIIRAFIIVLMSINMLNDLITKEQNNLLKNAVFLICIGFIIYFTYSALVEIFWIYGINESAKFMTNVFTILTYINLFVNLLFALAIIWIPTRQIFTTPS